MADNTKKGLSFLLIGSILAFFNSVTTIIVGSSMFFLSLLSLLLLIGGIIYIALGRKEFSERHEKLVVIGVTLLSITIILTFISVSGIVYSAFTTGSYESLVNVLYIAFFVSILQGISYLLILHELQDKLGRIFLYVVFLISIIISTYVIFNGLSLFDKYFNDIISTSEFTSEINLLGGFGLISSVLFIIVLALPYYRISRNLLVPNKTNLPPQNTLQQQSTDAPNYKQCPKCGSNNSSNAAFCTNCGENFY